MHQFVCRVQRLPRKDSRSIPKQKQCQNDTTWKRDEPRMTTIGDVWYIMIIMIHYDITWYSVWHDCMSSIGCKYFNGSAVQTCQQIDQMIRALQKSVRDAPKSSALRSLFTSPIRSTSCSPFLLCRSCSFRRLWLSTPHCVCDRPIYANARP